MNFKAINTLHCSLNATKAWRPTMIAIHEAKDLNKISLDEICGSLLTYEQEVNQFDEEDKKEMVEKKKSLALKISSREEETYESVYEDAKMSMLVRRYNKLALQRDHRMGRRNFRRDRFRNDASRNNQITCFDCKQPGHIRIKCPLNKKAKKEKKKKKAMVATWSDSDVSSSDENRKSTLKPLSASWQRRMKYVMMTLMIMMIYNMSMIVYSMILKNSWKNVKHIEKPLHLLILS